MIEGSKAHSKEMRARRRTQKEIRFENTLPWMVKARRCTRKEVEKYRDFSGGLILVGQRISRDENKSQKSNNQR
jgi:hypothetical protein